MKENNKFCLWEKIILYFFGIITLIVLLSLLVMNYADNTYCEYKSDNLLIKGSCSQFFLISHFNGALKLIVADYDYNNIHRIIEWDNKLLELGIKLNLNQTEKLEMINNFNDFRLSFLWEVHGDIY